MTAGSTLALAAALTLALVSSSQCRVAAAATSLTLIQPEWGYYFDQNGQGDGGYSFGYDVEDAATGNAQFRRERRLPNGTVAGSYGLVEPDGNVRVAHYTADHRGYRVTIENSRRPDERHPAAADWTRSAAEAGEGAAAQHAFRHAVEALGRPPPPDDRRTPPARDYGALWDYAAGDRSQHLPAIVIPADGDGRQ